MDVYDLFSWRSWFRTPLFLGPQLLKCILQYPLLFPVIIVSYCLVLVISHAKSCFQFYTTFSKRYEINREGSSGAATMTEFLPHTLWENKRERPGCLLTQGRGKQHYKALTCHFFQSWGKLPGQPETQEIWDGLTCHAPSLLGLISLRERAVAFTGLTIHRAKTLALKLILNSQQLNPLMRFSLSQKINNREVHIISRISGSDMYWLQLINDP